MRSRLTRRDDGPAVCRHAQAPDHSGVSFERMATLSADQVPHAQNLILTPQHGNLAIKRHAIGWSISPNQGRKSGANELEGFKADSIVRPFRTSQLFTAGFGQVL